MELQIFGRVEDILDECAESPFSPCSFNLMSQSTELYTKQLIGLKLKRHCSLKAIIQGIKRISVALLRLLVVAAPRQRGETSNSMRV